MADSLGTVYAGHVATRFVYTRGDRGWGVTSRVGMDVPEIRDQGIRLMRGLPSAQGLAVPPPHERPRRIVWGGDSGSIWRYLVNTYAAGTDASQRGGNSVHDCLVVQRDETSNGQDPGVWWTAEGWVTAYGAEEVAQIDVAGAPVPEPPVSGPALVRICEDSRIEGNAGPLNGLAALVIAVDRLRSTPAPTAQTVILDQIQGAGPLLSALFSVMPFDVGWDTTFEVCAGVAAEGSPALTLSLVEERWATDDRGESLDFTQGFVEPDPMELDLCDQCGSPQETWATLVSRFLTRLAVLIREPSRDAAQVADALVEYIAELRAQRVTAAQFPWRFSDECLAAAGKDLGPLLDAPGLRFRLGVDHSHPKPVRPDVPVKSAKQVALLYLAEHGPSDVSFLLADLLRQRQPNGSPAADPNASLIDTHLRLAPAPSRAEDLLKRYAGADVTGLPDAFQRGVEDQILRALVILACDGQPYSGSVLAPLTPAVVIEALRRSRGDWYEPLLIAPVAGAFLMSWAFPAEGRSGLVSFLRESPTNTRENLPLGHYMAHSAFSKASQAQAWELQDEIRKLSALNRNWTASVAVQTCLDEFEATLDERCRDSSAMLPGSSGGGNA